MGSRHSQQVSKQHKNAAFVPVKVHGARVPETIWCLAGADNKSLTETEGFAQLYELSPIERINLIRAGLNPTALKEMIQRMDLSQEKVLDYLALPVATINRKIKRGDALSPDESAKVLGLASLIGQAQTIVERSGNPEGFDAAKWFAEWMERPQPALGGAKPAEYMDTTTGQNLVSDLLGMMESGAYA